MWDVALPSGSVFYIFRMYSYLALKIHKWIHLDTGLQRPIISEYIAIHCDTHNCDYTKIHYLYLTS